MKKEGRYFRPSILLLLSPSDWPTYEHDATKLFLFGQQLFCGFLTKKCHKKGRAMRDQFIDEDVAQNLGMFWTKQMWRSLVKIVCLIRRAS